MLPPTFPKNKEGPLAVPIMSPLTTLSVLKVLPLPPSSLLVFCLSSAAVLVKEFHPFFYVSASDPSGSESGAVTAAAGEAMKRAVEKALDDHSADISLEAVRGRVFYGMNDSAVFVKVTYRSFSLRGRLIRLLRARQWDIFNDCKVEDLFLKLLGTGGCGEIRFYAGRSRNGACRAAPNGEVDDEVGLSMSFSQEEITEIKGVCSETTIHGRGESWGAKCVKLTSCRTEYSCSFKDVVLGGDSAAAADDGWAVTSLREVWATEERRCGSILTGEEKDEVFKRQGMKDRYVDVPDICKIFDEHNGYYEAAGRMVRGEEDGEALMSEGGKGASPRRSDVSSPNGWRAPMTQAFQRCSREDLQVCV